VIENSDAAEDRPNRDVWRYFVERLGGADRDYVVAAFGDTAAMATELPALVVDGTKRATCSLARDYADPLIEVDERFA
jgi:uncharacterized protein YhfF